MKDKKYKYLEDLVEDYLRLSDEKVDIPSQITRLQEKYEAFLEQHETELIADEAQPAFKLFYQLKKYEEYKSEVEQELAEVEKIFIDFLNSLNGMKISYEKKDDNKSRMTYLFWVEGEELKWSRH